MERSKTERVENAPGIRDARPKTAASTQIPTAYGRKIGAALFGYSR